MNIVILFTSYYFADKTDKILTKEGLDFKLIPVPTEISGACGMAIRIKPEWLTSVQQIMEENRISSSHIYYYEKGKEPILYKKEITMVGFTLPREYIDDMVVRMAHHSTAIEGNSLTQGETKSILLDSMIPRKMELREFYEVSNYKAYLAFLLDTFRSSITIDIIKETQRLLLNQIRDDNGQFKVIQNMVIGADFEPTKPYQVLEALKNWCDTLEYRLDVASSDEDKVRAIMEQHFYFERIHPFADGNGRTGRALIVHSCLQQELAPIIINKDERGDYMTLLNDGDLEGLYQLGFELFEKERERMLLFGQNFKV